MTDDPNWEDGFDMGEYLGSNEDAAAEEAMIERHDVEMDEGLVADLQNAVSFPQRIRELVAFMARQDREMEEAILMEGDDEWLASLTGPQLGDALSEAERMIRAARVIKKIVEQHLETDIVENGAIRLGDSGYYVGSSTTRTLHDSEGLLRWLRTPERIHKAIRVTASNVRITDVRHLAEEDDLDVFDTFFEETTEDDQLKKVPESRAKWVQGLESGERR